MQIAKDKENQRFLRNIHLPNCLAVFIIPFQFSGWFYETNSENLIEESEAHKNNSYFHNMSRSNDHSQYMATGDINEDNVNQSQINNKV